MSVRSFRSVQEAAWNSIEVPIAVSSASGIEDANPAFSVLAEGNEAFLGSALATLVVQPDRERVASLVASVLGGGVDESAQEVTFHTAGGPSRTVVHTCRAVNVNGTRLAFSTFEGWGQRRAVTDSSAIAAHRGSGLGPEEAVGRFVATIGGQVVDCDDVLARILGCDARASLVGRNLLDFTPDGPVLQKLLAVARAEGRAGPAEFQMARSDGALVDVSCLISGAAGGEATVSLHGQMAEITDRKRLETRLQGAERMEVVGRLAGGLAHDFNNLLTVISGNTERLLEAMTDHDPLRGAAAAIDHAAARAARLTRQLLAYGRRQVFELRPVSLQNLVADQKPLLVDIVGSRINVDVRVPSDAPRINADARQLEQVLANLALNAREAMPSGGVLTVSVDAVEVAESEARERMWLRPGRYVRLVVSDTGQGMDAVTRASAFQPFFTTKRMGEGRGLGLATVYGIVKQSRGFIWIESEVGRGATFTLLFPAIHAGVVDAAAVGSVNVHETILVVEADTAVRTFVGEALRRRGYRTLDAGSGPEAIQIFASHPSRVHLVLSDGNAVADQGIPLVTRLRTIDPRVQSLVMIEPHADDASGPGVLPTTPCIQKPFTLQALADKVREVLESGEGRG
jgi:signal transduction histidine kinase